MNEATKSRSVKEPSMRDHVRIRSGKEATAAFLSEPIALLGFPQIIATRAFVYEWLKARGWNPSERGFASLDYAAFGREAVNAPLTPEAERDALLAQVAKDYER